jgi:hypothetical protein
MTWHVTIANWRPRTVNELLSMHWRACGRAKAGDMNVIAIHCYAAKVPKATGRRAVSIRMVCAKGRSLDPDAVPKSLLDALVQAGYLMDDNTTWLQFDGCTIERGKQLSTNITIRDI